MANIQNAKHPKNQKVLQTSEKQLFQGKHPISQTSEKTKSAANMQKPALPGQTSDISNIQKLKSAAFIRNQLYHGKHPIYQTSEKPKSAAIIRKPALLWQTSDMPNIRKTKSAAIIRNAAFPGQTSDMSNIRITKKCCKHAKPSFSTANIRYVRHPKNQKEPQTCENQLYEGKHPICLTSEKPKSAGCWKHPETKFSRGNIRYVKHPVTQKCCKHPKSSFSMANIRDVNYPKKNKKCCKHPKSSFSRANIRCVKHPKNQKLVQTCENKLYQGKHPICQTSEKPKSAAFIRNQLYHGKHPIYQTSEKPKSAANIRKPALPWQKSDMSNIRKNKKCWMLETSGNQIFQGKHPICQTSSNPKVLQTSEN